GGTGTLACAIFSTHRYSYFIANRKIRLGTPTALPQLKCCKTRTDKSACATKSFRRTIFVEWVFRGSISNPVTMQRSRGGRPGIARPPGGNSIMGCGCGFTRREVLRAGSLAAAGLLTGARLSAQAKKGMRID